MQDFVDWYLHNISMGGPSRVVFATEIFIAELLFMLPYKRRRGFAWRAPLSAALYIAVAFFFPEQWLNLGSYITIPVFALSILLHKFCSGYSFKKVAFNCIGAYALQNISVNVAIVVRALLPWAAEYRILTDFLCAAVLFPLGWLCFARRSGKDEDININRIWMMLLTVGVVLLVDILVKIANYFPGGSADSVMLRVSMTFSDILALLLQYSSFRAGKLEKEKLRTEALLQAEQEQYRLSRETIELVNMKCHDLKHRLAQIRAEGGGAEQLKDVEEAVLFYENVAKTGNDALDSVLTQKSLSCEKHGIAFTYMADGAGLEAMQPSDVWSLLGNALDNAIESCAQEGDPQKRIVFLNIGAKDGLLRMRVENYCSRPVRFEEGLPVTTKADRQNHGIGVRSIRYIAQKYGGNAVFSAEDGFFRLSVLIPLAS